MGPKGAVSIISTRGMCISRVKFSMLRDTSGEAMHYLDFTLTVYSTAGHYRVELCDLYSTKSDFPSGSFNIHIASMKQVTS